MTFWILKTLTTSTLSRNCFPIHQHPQPPTQFVDDTYVFCSTPTGAQNAINLLQTAEPILNIRINHSLTLGQIIMRENIIIKLPHNPTPVYIEGIHQAKCDQQLNDDNTTNWTIQDYTNYYENTCSTLVNLAKRATK